MDVGAWLRSLGLGQYETTFREADIDGEVLPDLTDSDLGQLGISLGHRKRILKAIANIGLAAPLHAAHTFAPTSSTADVAERRQLTVMFCDLVGSTALSARLDPEDMREIVGAYHRTCAEQITKAGGFVAKYMGDGVLAYFGYPQAHEHDAERAVLAGLALVETVPKLKTAAGAPLQVRVGIATGLVVVGDLIGQGSAQEQAVVGETPNLAARLQALAEPNMVVIADSTRRLLGNLFELKDLGSKNLKGIAGPARVWAALRASSVESRFEALHTARLTALVGREEEFEALLRRWSRAKIGEGQVVLISGEAGIGKSRLTAALLERLADEPHTRLRYFCSPQRTDSALHPFIGQMERAAGLAYADKPQAKLDKLDAVFEQASTSPEDAALLTEMLSLPNDGRYPALELTPNQHRQRTLEALASQLAGLARQRPVLLIFEDAHWVDPTSLEVLGRAVDRVKTLPVLLIVTFRPEFAAPWVGQSHVTSLTLNRLGERETAAIIARLVGSKALPADVMAEIVERTDGIPLFVEEMTKAVLEAESEGAARRTAAAVPSRALAVPASLHASLMARLDRLGPAKEVAQIGSAIGREFSHALLAAVARKSEAELGSALDRLVQAGLLFRQGAPPHATYLFKHALVQDAAYGTLLRANRSVQHRRVAEALEKQFPETVEKQPEILAYHYTEAGLAEPAIAYWRKAGQRAAKRAANTEAIYHLRRGLAVLETLPDRAARADEELAMLLALGPALMSTRSSTAPEVQEVYGCARRIANDTGKVKELFATIFGLWLVAYSNGNCEAARSYTSELMSIAQNQSDPGYLLQAHHCAWGMELYIGNFEAAHKHIEAGLPLYDKEAHRNHAVLYAGHDPEPCGYVFDALALQALGRADSSLAQLEKGVALARELAHPPTSIHVFGMCGDLFFLRRDPTRIMSLAAEWLSLTSSFGSAVGVANAMMARGWATTLLGGHEAGLAELRDGLDRWRSTGSKAWGPNRLGRAVAAFIEAGEVDQAVVLLAEAFQAMENTGQRWYEAELHRLQGLLASLAVRTAEAEACFEGAINVARSQGARLFELRAAMALSRLQCGREQRKRRRALLVSIYGGFAEGFDTPDLEEARALLDELV